MNNLPRDFKVVQEHARAKLDEGRKVGLDKVEWRNGCLHELRWSFGTHVVKAVPMHELQKLMRHSSITVTAQLYTEINSDMQAKARAVFAATG